MDDADNEYDMTKSIETPMTLAKDEVNNITVMKIFRAVLKLAVLYQVTSLCIPNCAIHANMLLSRHLPWLHW